jgi:putative ABC transport system ATP-binding protein
LQCSVFGYRPGALGRAWRRLSPAGFSRTLAGLRAAAEATEGLGSVVNRSLFRFVWENSWREQLGILLLIALSLPFYWVSLEIPKRIVNEALQGHAFRGGVGTVPATQVSPWAPEWLVGAMRLDQMQFLFVLSAIYLFLVLVNGAFKYAINLRKGILGERMLRRLRYKLVDLFLRFRPEEARAAKPAEIASMVKDEVEPIGGFIGDAFIQPAFLGAQALTALAFIIAQNAWLGLLAFSIVLIQSVVIPLLRREQIRLGRERQIASRRLAGRIGEIVEGAPAILTHGTVHFNLAEVGTRLGGLFNIRAKLFRRKFAVKFLNNLLSQITPFLFFSVGGYLALRGRLDIGQLVAVIAAYRDLPPPIKELIDWDQQRLDVSVKYEQVVSQFAPQEQQPARELPDNFSAAPIVLDGLQVTDRLGTPLFEAISARIDRPSHVALTGPASRGRSALARALGRQITEYRGAIRIGSISLAELPYDVASRSIAFASTDPSLFHGSIRDNIVFSLNRVVPKRDPATARSREERIVYIEAMLSGNLVLGPKDEWIDFAAAGVSGPDELDERILEVLRLVGLHEDVFRLGLLGRLDPACSEEVKQRLIEARHAMTQRLRSDGLERYVEPFDPAQYNANASVGENLLFGTTANGEHSELRLAADPRFRRFLLEQELIAPLLAMGRKIAETTIEMFDGLPAGNALFERYSFIRADEMPDYKRIVASGPGTADSIAAPADQARLIGLALSYIEPRHRFRLLDAPLQARIVRARQALRAMPPSRLPAALEFYDPERPMLSASIKDNLLFGRLAFDLPHAEQKVWHVMREMLRSHLLEPVVYRTGLEFDVGPQGKYLDQRQRVAVDLARCLIRRPDVLVVDGSFSVYEEVQAKAVLEDVRRTMHDATLIVSLSDGDMARTFDQVFLFEGPRVEVVMPALRTEYALQK